MIATTNGPVDVSVLVPARDEAETLPLFLAECRAALSSGPIRYEIVVVNDGSRDATGSILAALQREHPNLTIVTHRMGRGIAAALRSAGHIARGAVHVFYPADLQFKPEDIPRLAEPVLAGEADIVTGYKQGHYEKAFVSTVYNALSRRLFNVGVRDLNNVKAWRREVMAHVPNRPDWHRYMVVVAAADGCSLLEVPIPLYPRHAGRSKFGWSRIPVGVLDMLAVWFELRFGQKPLLLFGMLGAMLFALGTLAGLSALVWLALTGEGVRAIWTVVQTALLLGSIFFATGLLGEQIAAQRAEVRELRRELEARAPVADE
jgi:glycosyltransferase involved in cell wall biosynthesis